MSHYENGTGHREQRPLVQLTEEPTVTNLGPVMQRTDIKSSMGPFHFYPEYGVQYPEVVTQALSNLYAEYNQAFAPIVEANREWDTDYQYATDQTGMPVNSFVQIDMVGLPDSFLAHAQNASVEEMTEALRGNIFEYENSLAMYQLLERVFSQDGQPSNFDTQFRASLDVLRQTHGKPIALLAVTEQKHKAMRESEFGKMDGEELHDAEVMELSGFDRLFGPEDFQEHVMQNGGESEYLLYVRSSDPVVKLKDPTVAVQSELLSDDDMRRIIKAHAITFNVDNPNWGVGDPRKINDTKAWMEAVGMAHNVHDSTSLYSAEFLDYIRRNGLEIESVVNGGGTQSNKKKLSDLFVAFSNGNGQLLADPFINHLQARGINPDMVASGNTNVRFKPMQSSYGAYGHCWGPVNRYRTFNAVATEIKHRGPYVAQPEMKIPQIIDEQTGEVFNIIDRNFMANVGGQFVSMGGFRSMMPAESIEAKKGRNHGSVFTRWAEIT